MDMLIYTWIISHQYNIYIYICLCVWIIFHRSQLTVKVIVKQTKQMVSMLHISDLIWESACKCIYRVLSTERGYLIGKNRGKNGHLRNVYQAYIFLSGWYLSAVYSQPIYVQPTGGNLELILNVMCDSQKLWGPSVFNNILGGRLLFCLWASCQIRRFAGCACAGNAGKVFPAAAIPTYITARAWCTCRDACRGR